MKEFMRQKRSERGFNPSTQSPVSKQKKTEYMKEFMRQKRSEKGFNPTTQSPTSKQK